MVADNSFCLASMPSPSVCADDCISELAKSVMISVFVQLNYQTQHCWVIK